MGDGGEGAASGAPTSRSPSPIAHAPSPITRVWIGTSGWVYADWGGRFYPPGLPRRDWLDFYARHFATVEINRSYYRLPTRAQFEAWAAQTAGAPGFRFAVKASRYITHMKKLRGTEDAVDRLMDAAAGLGPHLGPILYQLPPRWHVDPERLRAFVAGLPPRPEAVFEFRDPTWFVPEVMRILEDAGCGLALGIGGGHPTPLDRVPPDLVRYLRFHHGAHGIGFTDAELRPWAEFLVSRPGARALYAYFNNDPGGNAVADARRLRAMLGPDAANTDRGGSGAGS